MHSIKLGWNLRIIYQLSPHETQKKKKNKKEGMGEEQENPTLFCKKNKKESKQNFTPTRTPSQGIEC